MGRIMSLILVPLLLTNVSYSPRTYGVRGRRLICAYAQSEKNLAVLLAIPT